MVQTSKNLDAGSAAESPHAKPAASALETQETYVGAGEDPDVADGRAAKIQKLTHVPDSHNHPLLREADVLSHPMAAHKMAELDLQEESSAQNKQTSQLDWTVDLSFPDHFSFEDHTYRGTPNNATTLDGHELHHLWGETGFADPGGLYTVDHLNNSLTPLWNIGQAREHNPPEPLVFDQLAQQVGEQPADMFLTNSLVADHQLWPADATLINAQTSAHTGAYQGGVAAYRNVGIQLLESERSQKAYGEPLPCPFSLSVL
nr:hypothetical protein B0A51_11582 [Rachicladosporium sp. CCFEE 5018]